MRRSLLGSTAVGTLVVALAGAPAPADAGSTAAASYSFPNSNGLDWSLATFGGISGFNPSLGNLQSVLVVEKLTAHLKGSVSSGSTTVSSAVVHGSVKLTLNNGPSGMMGLPVLAISAPQGYYNNATDQGKPASQLSTTPQLYDSGVQTTSNGSGTVINSPGSDWDNPKLSITLSSESNATATSAVPYFIFNHPNVTETFDLTLTYNYTTGNYTTGGDPPGYTTGGDPPGQVPEPASALVLGTGVLALGKLRRRKKQKQA